MSAPRTNQVLDEFQRPVPGASIYVSDATGKDAVLTSDGTSPLVQPVITDPFGNYSYWAVDGLYTESIYYGGKLRYKQAGVVIGTAADTLQGIVAILEAAATAAADSASAAEQGVAAEAASRSAADASIQEQLLAVINNSGTLPTDQVIVTPEAYGAVRYDPANEVDASIGLQAFFDAFQSEDFARQHVGDWSGEWMVTKTIMAAYWNGAPPNVERRFRMGTLRVPTLARLPGTLPLDPVLDIAGFRQTWQGVCGIHTAGLAQTVVAQRPYASRSVVNGVRMRFVADSTFGDFAVSCARRNGVKFSTKESGGFVLNGITFPNAENEACRIGRVDGVFVGSTDRGYEATPLTAVKTQGFTSSVTGVTFTNGEVFVNNPSGHANSFDQRTQIAVGSTADLAALDLIKSRLELTPAVYGTIAADNATKAFIWSAGDPTNIDGAGHGLQVGDRYPMFANGSNANREFRIVSFGGTSNRTITVTDMRDGSGPTTMAASADPSFSHYSKWSLHLVTAVPDSTHALVLPWIPDRHNSALHIVHGAVFATDGGDLANSSVEAIITSDCAIAADIVGLFLPRIGTILGESCTVGLKMGGTPDDGALGLVVQHAHIGVGDGCDIPIASMSSAINGSIKALSAFTLSECFALMPRAGTNDQDPPPQSLGHIDLDFDGYILELQNGRFDTNPPSTIDNSKPNRQAYLTADSAALTVDFARDEYRLFLGHNWTEIVWMGSAGGPPTGTLTLDMHAALAALGWTFAGAIVGTTGSFSAVTKSQHVKMVYIPSLKKISVMRLSGV